MLLFFLNVAFKMMVALNALYNFIVTLKKGKKKSDKSTADRNATVSKYVSLHVYSESAIQM